MTKRTSLPVIGILGGGQLGLMLGREARRMGFHTAVWDPDEECPARRQADLFFSRPYADEKTRTEFADACDVVTYEFEHLPVGVVRALEERVELLPGSRVLAVCQDRKREKEMLRNAGFPLADAVYAHGRDELIAAVERMGLPVVIKTTHAGYDGKGQMVLERGSDLHESLRLPADDHASYVVERKIDLAAELSVVVVRGRDGAMTTFPVARNEHRNNILHSSIVPGDFEPAIVAEAERLARAAAETLDLKGILCVEQFLASDGRLLVNELAPRPHNSGHYTIEACDLSQFEALIRVLAGLPVPTPRLLAPSAMVNLLGISLDGELVQALSAIPGARLHWYGKRKSMPGRKMGHVTVAGGSGDSLGTRLEQIERAITAAADRHRSR